MFMYNRVKLTWHSWSHDTEC